MSSKNESEFGTRSKSNLTREERQMMRNYLNGALPLMALSFAFLASFAYLVIYDKINLDQFSGSTAKDLVDFPSRVIFVLQNLTPAVMWLSCCMIFVMQRRVGSPALNPMLGYENLTQAARNNFTNSLEQFVMLSISQLILITHLDAATILKVIPALNLLFIIGRVTFWIGYPRYRAFGFMVTSVPIMVTIGYNLYKFYTLYFIFFVVLNAYAARSLLNTIISV